MNPALPHALAPLVNIARAHGARSVAPVAELIPRGSIRTFRVGDSVLRVDLDEHSTALAREHWILRVLDDALDEPCSPEPVFSGTAKAFGNERPVLVYRYIDGPVIDPDADISERRRPLPAIAEAFARLHTAPVFDLLLRLKPRAPMSLMAAFKNSGDQLRTWALERERDGLGHDLLTQTLFDQVRALRPYAIAQDRVFRVSPRRVLVHGRPHPDSVVTDAQHRARFVLFDHAHLGDAASDLAAYAVVAHLSTAEEEVFLNTYINALPRAGRRDETLIPRYFARKYVEYLARVGRELAYASALKRGDLPVVGDALFRLEQSVRQCRIYIADALAGLALFFPPRRPTSAREVAGMGQVVAFEELLLQGRTFRIALTGLPYAGKTEVGATVARRLGHLYYNTSVLARALAHLEQTLYTRDGVMPKPTALVRELFERGLHMEPLVETPFYRVTLQGTDITGPIRADADFVRAGQLLDDEVIQQALHNEIVQAAGAQGVVVEGTYANRLLPSSAKHFHLRAKDEVRRVRLMRHRHDLTDEEEAATLLSALDAPHHPPADKAKLIDMDDLPAAAAARALLAQLLPASRRRFAQDLSGRRPL